MVAGGSFEKRNSSIVKQKTSLSTYERNEEAFKCRCFPLRRERGDAQLFVLAPDAEVDTFTFQMFE
jgi:hypothetical protein